MNPRQGRSLLSLYSVDVFLDANAERLPKTCATGTCIRFRRALAEVELHVQVQSAAPLMAMGLTRAKDAKREALLRDHVAPIVRIARLEQSSHPELAPLKMPRGEPGTSKLLAQAAGMADVAAGHRDVFVSAGLRPTFVEDLNSAIDDVMATLTGRSERRGATSGATKGLEASLRDCHRDKAVLASFIETELRDNTPLLVAWRTVQRVGRSARHRRKNELTAGMAPPSMLATPAQPIRDVSRLLPTPTPQTAAPLPNTITERRA
jgi:hypothetical protein